MKSKSTAVLVSCALALSGASVFAHGEKQEDDHMATGKIDREQREWGVAAAPDEATRTIEVSMADTMKFTPDSIDVKKGETVKFVISNVGKATHEFVLGTPESIDEHNTMMKRFPNMEHAEPFMSHVSAGDSEELIWTFNRDGTVKFACLLPGHYEAGMVGQVSVGKSTSN